MKFLRKKVFPSKTASDFFSSAFSKVKKGTIKFSKTCKKKDAQ